MQIPLALGIRVLAVLIFAMASPRSAVGECVRVVPGPTVCEELAKADIVFEADVLDIELRQGTGFQKVDFRTLRTFKGDQKDRWSGVFSWTSNDHHFQPNTRVIVYATERGGIWHTGCNRTKVYEERENDRRAEEVAQLTRCGSPAK